MTQRKRIEALEALAKAPDLLAAECLLRAQQMEKGLLALTATVGVTATPWSDTERAEFLDRVRAAYRLGPAGAS